MEDNNEFYILGEPIDTSIGKVNFLKVKDYPKLMKLIPYLNLEMWEIIKYVESKDKQLGEYLSKFNYITMIYILQDTFDIYSKLNELFNLCLEDKNDIFTKISTDEELEYYKNLIRKMNCVTYTPKNPNPEIEKFNNYSRMLKSKNDLSFESMYTSIMLYMGMPINDLTIYQLNALFARINQFYNFEISANARIQGSEGDIEPWYKSLDVNKGEEKEKLDVDLNTIKNGVYNKNL